MTIREQVDYLQQLQMAIGSQQLSQKNLIVGHYQEGLQGLWPWNVKSERIWL